MNQFWDAYLFEYAGRRVFPVMMLLIFCHSNLAAQTSSYTVSSSPSPDGKCHLHVIVRDATTGELLPVRAIVKDDEGTFYDGSGRGVYRDGRFFVEGTFHVTPKPGRIVVQLSHGPHFDSLQVEEALAAERQVEINATLARWLDPGALGWYSGDNHVHAQHDAEAAVKTDLEYAALQGRANGLSFITEAGSNVDYDRLELLSQPGFLIQYAPEIRPGPYVGHFNTPGIRTPIPSEQYDSTVQRPLPGQAIVEAIHQRGGVVIHTHPMTPPHQLHWMGATEAFSDAVTRQTTDLFDVDAEHTQQLWFAMLNLGNRVGVSSYTDSALGRTSTLSPGDRRIYCHCDEFTPQGLLEAMRQGRTIATNGGPVLADLELEGHGIGSVVATEDRQATATFVVHTRAPLRNAELFQDGKRIARFETEARTGEVSWTHSVAIPEHRSSWIVGRAEDVHGKWCLTSPIYLTPPHPDSTAHDQDPSSALLLEISNAARFVELRPTFFAHLITTVARDEQIDTVELRRNNEPLVIFTATEGDQLAANQMPVTGPRGDYEPGWTWWPNSDAAYHFQADYPVTLSGWYCLRVKTRSGRTFESDQLMYSASDNVSRTLSVANLRGRETSLSHWGYGEDLAISDLGSGEASNDWWYSRHSYWQLKAQFGSDERVFGWPREQPVVRFRSAVPSSSNHSSKTETQRSGPQREKEEK